MITVFGVVFLQHANVGRPAEVVVIDERNGPITLFVGHVLGVCIVSLAVGARAGKRLGLSGGLGGQLRVDLGSDLQGDVIRGLLDLVLVRDDSNFNVLRISLDGDGFLHVVVRLLDAEEALNLVVFHCEGVVRH